MKIRISLVSNSSSQSFIINKCEKFPDILALAEFMSDIRLEDDDKDWFGRKVKQVRRRIKHLREQKTEHEYIEVAIPNGVRFSSINYDTFIYDNEDEFWVSTCNNHPFYQKLEQYRNKERERDDDILEGYTNKEYLEFSLGKDFSFMDLEL